MNVTLRDVYLTSPDGERFWKLKEIYIKGNVVSALLSMPDRYRCAPTSPERILNSSYQIRMRTILPVILARRSST